MTATVQVIGHPLVQHKLTLMRKKTTPTAEFRRLLRLCLRPEHGELLAMGSSIIGDFRKA